MRFKSIRAGEFFQFRDSVVEGMLWLKIRDHAIVWDEGGEMTMNAVDVDGQCPGLLHVFDPDDEVERVIVGVKLTIGGER